MLADLLVLLLASYTEPAKAKVDQPAMSADAVVPEPEITVTGKQAEERTVSGSRVPRKVEPDPRGFVSQIASDTGVAGLVPQSGMDPFAGGTRKITAKNCKSSDSRMTIVALCDLALAQKGILEGDIGSARAAIDRVLSHSKSGAADRFFAHRFSFQIATIENDAQDRSDALKGMLESGLLSQGDRVLARKTLASIAIARGDDPAAISELEQLVAEAPNEANAQANLGALYARAGLHDRARARIKTAVRLTAATGRSVPKSWSDYLKGPR